MIDRVCKVLGDLARPTAIYGLVGAIVLAVVTGAHADVVGALCAGLVGLYGSKAAENVGVAKATGAKP